MKHRAERIARSKKPPTGPQAVRTEAECKLALDELRVAHSQHTARAIYIPNDSHVYS